MSLVTKTGLTFMKFLRFIVLIAGSLCTRAYAAEATDLVRVDLPFGVEIGPDGALYVTEIKNHRVLRFDFKSKELTTVAGNGRRGYSGDGGPATSAEMNEPYEVRFDSRGNMLVVEMKNHIVRRIDAESRTIWTIAGTGRVGYGGDGGQAKEATLNQPHSIALDRRDNLYIADITASASCRRMARPRSASRYSVRGRYSLPPMEAIGTTTRCGSRCAKAAVFGG
jgi:streptogramin lyase